jgi:hypothetical protein
MSEKIAKKVVSAIVEDIEDRRGLRQEWENIDSDIQKEIKEEWAKLVLYIIDGKTVIISRDELARLRQEPTHD